MKKLLIILLLLGMLAGCYGGYGYYDSYGYYHSYRPFIACSTYEGVTICQ